MLGNFRSIGISYKEANLDIRSLLSLDTDQSTHLLHSLKENLGIQEAIVISTCNRTEVFYSHEQNLSQDIFNALFISKASLVSPDLLKDFVILDGREAVKRLFDIAIGIESQVLGDLQIINQVKKSYQQSADLELAGPFLHRLMHSIFFTNKKVVQETAFRDGAASVPYASYELIEELSTALIEPRILILGLGEMGKDVSLHLKDHEVKHVTLMNRTFAKTEALAKELSYEAKPIEDLHQELAHADIVLSSVAVNEPIITKEVIEQLPPFALKYFIDLSVPASINKAVESVSGVLLHTIDDIQNKTSDALLKREQAIPQVKAIIEESILEFVKWSQELNVSPTINKLKEALEQIRKEEISKYFNKMNEGEAEMVEMVTKSMVQKIIKLPVLELKAACKRGEADTLIDVLSGIFNLEETEAKVAK